METNSTAAAVDTKKDEKPAKFSVAALTLRQQEALEALVGERVYQDAMWNPKTTATGGKHSVFEFAALIQVIAGEALAILAHEAEPGASQKALHHIRKIGGCAVGCMEQNGVYKRALPAAATTEVRK